MSVSKHLCILSVGLLIVISGCSSNRLRHIFAPDREFLALNELEQYNRERGAELEWSEQPAESLVSLRKDAEDKAGNGERVGIFSISRWLQPKNRAVLPANPFLEDYPGEEATDNNSIVAVAHSDELPHGSVDEFSSEKDESHEIIFGETADAGAKGGSSRFADIMAEFEDEDEQADDLDALAEAWITGETDKAGAISFDPLPAKSDDKLTASKEPRNKATVWEFSALDEQLAGEEVEQSVYDLSEPGGIMDSRDKLDWNLEFKAMKAPYAGRQPDGLQTAGIIHGEASMDESLWQPANSSDGWESADFENIQDNHQRSAIAAVDTKWNWDFGPVTEVENSARNLPRVTQSFDPAAAGGGVPVGDPSTPIQRAPQTLMSARTDLLASGVHAFPSDVKSQALAVSPAPATTMPTVARKAGLFSFLSPRAWLMLLGVVVIAYLLFVPDRKNLRHPFKWRYR